MAKTADLLPGTLDLLILKAVSLKPLHGYGVPAENSADLRQRAGNPAGLSVPGALPPGTSGTDHG